MCFSSFSEAFRSACRVSVGAVVCLGVASCSFFVPAKQSIVIRSTDPDAILRVDGEYVGQGTATPKIARNKAHLIEVEKDGLRGATIVGSSLSPYGMLDILGGFLFVVPIIGIFAPGAQMLDRDQIVLDPH